MFNFSPQLAKGTEFPSEVEITDNSKLQTYTIRVKQQEGKVSIQSEDLNSYHQSFPPNGTADLENQQRLIYSYQHVISGFAARLTEEEVEAMKKEGWVCVSKSRKETMLQVQTTHTSRFLGLHQDMGLWKESNFGKAKATKRVQAEPLLDDDGQGTQTASTAANSFVKSADALGNVNGTASGMAPYAHLAIYKVCFRPDCPASDMLAGLDAAIDDWCRCDLDVNCWRLTSILSGQY
ncbi:hypothetical protein F0562_012733 [Nyssa sinensis]|uniref:Inhibitor I9 domain-containing protein n=1 Tax=Nyssa sinensis TaxID=561372 RepID=A0A5J4ZT51_9ASTE|nr:hypothetical protein F0562_012733 [Nyssa sinensis]